MKKRVLFVANDAVRLRLYTAVLDDEPDRWEIKATIDAWQALEMMKQSDFDVVVSDLRMPGLSGAELMGEIRTRCPHTSRIVLSDIADQEEVSRCLNSVHQFLAKPFEVRALKATLTRIGALDAYLQDEKLKALVGQLGTLPSLPTLYVQVMRELAAKNPSVEAIAEIVAQDPGMTARMLQIVNSAVLGLARKITSPFEAVQYLGLGTVRSLVLSAHIFSRFKRTPVKNFSANKVWSHAVASARLARRILRLEQASAEEAADAYVAGMLHDIGKLMLADSLPGQFQRALVLAADRQLPFHEAEKEVYGATHAGAAAYLLGLWGLPVSIVEAVAFHHTPGRSDVCTLTPLTAVHVANVLEYELSKAQHPGGPPQLDADYLAALGLENRVAVWRAESRRLLKVEGF